MAPDILHTPWGKQMKGARREAKRIHDEPRQSLFFCPHSSAYPALEFKRSGRTERMDHWQENEGRRMILFFATHLFASPNG